MRRIASACLKLAALVSCCLAAPNAPAQEYPSKPVSFVVPFAPGGATDLVARLISVRLAEALGKPVLVENRPGAGGTIGSGQVAKSAPDGHTLLMGTIATHGIGPSLYPSLPYDAVRDFVPVTQAASQVYVAVVHPSVPAGSIGELITLAKEKPGSLSYASAGSGTAAHLFAELFKSKAGVDLVHVPYRGAGPAMTDLLAGQVSMTFDVLLTTLQHIQSGGLRPLAVTSAQRSSVLADVPTLGEAGIKDYDAVGWNGVFVPAGTPPAVVARLGKEIRGILGDPSIKSKITEQGAEVVASTPEDFAAFVKDEIAKWREVVRATGTRVD
jgi:tripartite-type tricarboxylate transporter receptor subunit TctC